MACVLGVLLFSGGGDMTAPHALAAPRYEPDELSAVTARGADGFEPSIELTSGEAGGQARCH